MNYYLIEAIWKSTINKIAPATSVKLEGIRAESKEKAEQMFAAMMPAKDWYIVKIKQQ